MGRSIWITSAAFLFVIACSGSEEVYPDATDDTTSGGGDVAFDLGGDDDIGDICGGELGCGCETDDECNSGRCIEFGLGAECTVPCDPDCPEGYTCRVLELNDVPEAICTPDDDPQCSPCSVADDCGVDGAACLEYSAGSACALPCEDGACPPGYTCSGDDVCEPTLGTCTACYDADVDGFGFGPGCEGEDCDDTNPDVSPTAVELCDDIDQDCDGEPRNGFDLTTDINNCGACGETCSLANTTAVCSDSTCVVSVCDTGFENCDADPTNGCETATGSDSENCGACGQVCEAANAVGSCESAGCVFECSPGFDDCNGDGSDGCELATDTDPANCGGCGIVCDAPNSISSCAAGTCLFECAPGFDDCNGDATDGCEQATQSDPNNCGRCGNTCASGLCEDGSCLNCLDTDGDGFGVGPDCAGPLDCNDRLDSVFPGAEEFCDGIDTDCDGDNDNVDLSGMTCSTGLEGVCDPGTFSCELGALVCTPDISPGTQVEVCDGDDNDCDGEIDEDAADAITFYRDADDDLFGDPALTTRACSPPSGYVTTARDCDDARSGVNPDATDLCNGIDDDCSGTPDDDLTVTESDPSNCGSCGNVCSVANGTPDCVARTCIIAACDPSWDDCDGSPANGCEANLTDDPLNCGSCGFDCASVGATSCISATCF